MQAGLTYPLANALGVTSLEWETVSDMDPAEISMSGRTHGRDDAITYGLDSIPIPIIHKDFSINIRRLSASRNNGSPLDVTQAALASRLVAEATERILFNGASIKVSGKTIYGYTTAPNRNTGSLTGDWSITATTGEEIVADVIRMIGVAVTKNQYGPYMLYVPITYGNKLNEDYKANSDLTIRERILEIEGIQGIRSTPNLVGGTNGQVVLVQMQRDTVDLIDGMQPQTIQWDEDGGMVVNFKVMSILVPRMKIDQATQSGIMHYTA
jgi:uncharacterized linocin/CFP29 family protein